MSKATVKLREKLEREARYRNSCYDRYGMDNTAETVDPVAYAVLLEAEAQPAPTDEQTEAVHDTCPNCGFVCRLSPRKKRHEKTT